MLIATVAFLIADCARGHRLVDLLISLPRPVQSLPHCYPEILRNCPRPWRQSELIAHVCAEQRLHVHHPDQASLTACATLGVHLLHLLVLVVLRCRALETLVHARSHAKGETT